MGWLWLIIAIITFAVSMYIIGRHFSDDQDVGGCAFIGGEWKDLDTT